MIPGLPNGRSPRQHLGHEGLSARHELRLGLSKVLPRILPTISSKFRTKVLDQELILVPATRVATIVSKEYFDVYDKTGPGYSNYKP